MATLGDLMQLRIEQLDRRRVLDARRFAELDHDLCQICLARGEDKRHLKLSCGYAVDEVLPEAIDLSGVANEQLRDRGFFLIICKACRGRLLAHLATWRQEGLDLRETEKDHDGNLEPTDPERNIPVRVHGAIQWLTRAEWEARRGGVEPVGE